MPTPSLIQFGNADDGTTLHWIPFTCANPLMACLVGHGGGHKNGGPGPQNICQDLQAASIDAYAYEYRMTVKKLPGQRSAGQVPDQADDMLVAINKLLLTYPMVVSIGCSAGGSLALTNSDKLAKAVVLSSDSDYTVDRDNDQFNQAVTLYLGGHDAAAYSPVNIMRANQIDIPIFSTFYEEDMMPFGQHDSLVQACSDLGIALEDVVLPGVGHAQDSWPTVKTQVIQWLKS